MRLSRLTLTLLIVLLISHINPGAVCAQGPGGQPPALVAVGDVTTGLVAEEIDFVGTVYFKEVSEVASEVRGRVDSVAFDDGDRVEDGAVLVRLGTEILEKTIESTRAEFEQSEVDLEKARLDLKRTEALFNEKLTTEKAFDDSRFLVEALEKRSASINATLEALLVQLEKNSIKAPFDGVVLKRHVDRGEWVEPGVAVATLAAADGVDIIVNVPVEVMGSVRRGLKVSVAAAGGKYAGTVTAIVPAGDVQTRTFPVKIRVAAARGLAEGMEAVVALPRGEKKKSTIVPRDAVITKFGQVVVFAVVESKAKMIPVKVLGYSGADAGVISEGLEPGMKVVVKGNERINDGQPVNAMGSK